MKGIKREFDSGQMNLMVTIANAAAVALENAQLYQVQLETAEKLRELDKLKSQFLANMSHELRTPLNSIIGFSRVIMKGIDGPVTDMQTQDLTAIHNSGQHLLKLINDVLDVSKIEAGKMELAFDDNTNIADLIISAMSTAVGLTKDKPIKLERVIPAELPLVRADPTRVRQVLINFLSNAAKFTDEGFIRVEAKQVLNSKEPARNDDPCDGYWLGNCPRRSGKIIPTFLSGRYLTHTKSGGHRFGSFDFPDVGRAA